MRKLIKKANKGIIGLKNGKGGIVAEYFRNKAKEKHMEKKNDSKDN